MTSCLGFGFRVSVLGLRVEGCGLRVEGWGSVQGLGFRPDWRRQSQEVWGLG